MQEQRCKSCRWYEDSDPIATEQGESVQQGWCHRMPPAPRPRLQEEEDAGVCSASCMYPFVSARDFCGEWTAIVPDEPAITESPRLLTPVDVDKRLVWQIGRAEKLAKRGKIPHIVLPDGAIRFRPEMVETFIVDVPPRTTPSKSRAEDLEPDHLPPPDAGALDIAATPAVTSPEAR